MNPHLQHNRLVFKHRDVLATMILVIFLSQVVVPIVITIVMDEGPQFSRCQTLLTECGCVAACLRGYLTYSSTTLYTAFEHVIQAIMLCVCALIPRWSSVGASNVRIRRVAIWLLQQASDISIYLHVIKPHCVECLELILVMWLAAGLRES